MRPDRRPTAAARLNSLTEIKEVWKAYSELPDRVVAIMASTEGEHQTSHSLRVPAIAWRRRRKRDTCAEILSLPTSTRLFEGQLMRAGCPEKHARAGYATRGRLCKTKDKTGPIETVRWSLLLDDFPVLRLRIGTSEKNKCF